MKHTKITPPVEDRRLDRAAGVLPGAACGDALGVPYEFAPRLAPEETPEMVGGGLGPYAPGEYSDDTQMQVCIARVAATGADLLSEDALNDIATGFLDWKDTGATDMGSQTRAVLTSARRSARSLRAATERLHRSSGRTAGNGSLMRTGIIALAYLDDVAAMAAAARVISELTHFDPLAGDACVLWCAAIRRAVLDATLTGLRDGLALLPAERRDQWATWLDEAETHPPARFSPNGYVVTALQAAWSAISHTPIPANDPAADTFACQHLTHALQTAVRAGDDTDTVAAIAGALLGARWGASAVPSHWLRAVHGWPGLRAADLIRLGVLTYRHGHPDSSGWPTADHQPAPPDAQPYAVPHPHDDGVLLGSLRTLRAPVDAAVSLCRLGAKDRPAVPAEDRVQVWLIDAGGRNGNLAYAIDQAAHAVADLRDEGKTVLLHCAAGRSRTVAVAARYATLITGTDPAHAFDTIDRALPIPQPRQRRTPRYRPRTLRQPACSGPSHARHRRPLAIAAGYGTREYPPVPPRCPYIGRSTGGLPDSAAVAAYRGGMVDPTAARSIAEGLLATDLPRRWRHVQGVAATAEKIAPRVPEADGVLIPAAWLHDIGYAPGLANTGFHPLDGARFLRHWGLQRRVVCLVAHHTHAHLEAEVRGLSTALEAEFPREDSVVADALCYCDMTTGPDGQTMTALERLAEIQHRYGPGHVVTRFIAPNPPSSAASSALNACCLPRSQRSLRWAVSQHQTNTPCYRVARTTDWIVLSPAKKPRSSCG